MVGLEDSLAMELAAVEVSASPQVQAAGKTLRTTARQQLLTMATVASARRTAGHQAREVSPAEVSALTSGQRGLADAAARFLAAAHDDLGVALA